jgi:hypothetical protein
MHVKLVPSINIRMSKQSLWNAVPIYILIVNVWVGNSSPINIVVFLDGICNKLNIDITQRDGFHKKKREIYL